MKKNYPLVWIVFSVLFISSCSTFQIESDIAIGRKLLLSGEPEAALVSFQQAAKRDGAYPGNLLGQGVLTYVGRAYYDAGKLAEARQAFETSLSRDDQDYLARLYLGLVLARNGNRARGAMELGNGLQGLNNTVEYIATHPPLGPFWDPRREIRSDIQRNISLLSPDKTDWGSLVPSLEALGKKIEREADLARTDALRDSTRGDN